MKHWRNHRKDRFFQQCSGSAGEPSAQPDKGEMEDWERKSFLALINETEDDQFPIFIRQGSGGIWSTTTEKDCFGHKIESQAELLKFYELYI